MSRLLRPALVLFLIASSCDNVASRVMDLGVADLNVADLNVADLNVADLNVADLSVADLSVADLSVADLSVADLSVADLGVADLGVADLGVADLSVVDLVVADLVVADLVVADLVVADLVVADLVGSPCAGKIVAGYCWYLATGGANCSDTCIPHGSTNDAAISYAGSVTPGDSSNATHCSDVIQAIKELPLTTTTTYVITSGYSAVPGVGCIQDYQDGMPGMSTIIRPSLHTVFATTQAAPSQSHLRRACACNE